jgi:hypothetical protein
MTERLANRMRLLVSTALAKGGNDAEKDTAACILFRMCRANDINPWKFAKLVGHPRREGWWDEVSDEIDALFPTLDSATHLTFGKYEGRLISEIAAEDSFYLEWLLSYASNLTDEARAAIAQCLKDTECKPS